MSKRDTQDCLLWWSINTRSSILLADTRHTQNPETFISQRRKVRYLVIFDNMSYNTQEGLVSRESWCAAASDRTCICLYLYMKAAWWHCSHPHAGWFIHQFSFPLQFTSLILLRDWHSPPPRASLTSQHGRRFAALHCRLHRRRRNVPLLRHRHHDPALSVTWCPTSRHRQFRHVRTDIKRTACEAGSVWAVWRVWFWCHA